MGFSQIINQEPAKAQLVADLTAKHFPSYLFVGAAGVGKRTMAVVLAKALCCENSTYDACDECYRCQAIERLSYPDVRIIYPVPPGATENDISLLLKNYAWGKLRPESPSNGSISIDRIRELKYEMGFRPIAGRRRVFIVIDADKMTNEAANSFLKTLEEPQVQTSFILTTERSSALLPTIRSRCQPVRFFGIPKSAISDFLEKKFSASKEIARIAADVAEGSIRRALDYVSNPEQFLSDEVRILFEQKSTIATNLSSLSLKLSEIPIRSLVNSFLFVYRQTLLAKLGFETYFSKKCQNLVDPEETISLEQVAAKLESLLSTLSDTELYLNKRLFLHSILVRYLA